MATQITIINLVSLTNLLTHYVVSRPGLHVSFISTLLELKPMFMNETVMKLKETVVRPRCVRHVGDDSTDKKRVGEEHNCDLTEIDS